LEAETDSSALHAEIPHHGRMKILTCAMIREAESEYDSATSTGHGAWGAMALYEPDSHTNAFVRLHHLPWILSASAEDTPV